MTDLAAEVTVVRRQAEEASRVLARAEVTLEGARAEAERALTRLSEEFGVSSVEEAERLLAELEQQVIAELDIVTTKLAETGEGSS